MVKQRSKILKLSNLKSLVSKDELFNMQLYMSTPIANKESPMDTAAVRVKIPKDKLDLVKSVIIKYETKKDGEITKDVTKQYNKNPNSNLVKPPQSEEMTPLTKLTITIEFEK